jgi:hypothetical protein
MLTWINPLHQILVPIQSLNETLSVSACQIIVLFILADGLELGPPAPFAKK